MPIHGPGHDKKMAAMPYGKKMAAMMGGKKMYEKKPAKRKV